VRHFKKHLVAVLLLVFGFTNTVWAANQDFETGLTDYNRSDWDGAITNFSKSIAAGFDLGDSYSYRAYSEAEKGQSNAAIADCNEAVKLNVNDAGGYYWRSRVEMDLTNYSAALTDFETGVRFGSHNAPDDLKYNLAGEYDIRARREFRNGNVEVAITNMNLAIWINPTASSFYQMRGWYQELEGHSGLAVADAYSAIKYGKLSSPMLVYETRAFARYESNDTSGALEDCDKVLEIYAKLREGVEDPKKLTGLESDPLIVEGLQNFINGDYEKAIQLWTDALKNFQEPPPPVKIYLQKWIEKAQSKLKEKTP
jgi:tetratricopeptide (TPR) repeat protein